MDVDADEDEDEVADKDSSEGSISPTSKPSWAKRLKNKMNALFCMQAKGIRLMLSPGRVAAATRRL